MMGPGASGGSKNLGSFMKSFAGNLGGQLSGMGQVGGMKQLMGGGEDDYDPTVQDNPGVKMFGGKPQGGGNSFLQRFGSNLSDQLFQRAMMGFMGRN